MGMLSSKYLDAEAIQKHRSFGGLRGLEQPGDWGVGR